MAVNNEKAVKILQEKYPAWTFYLSGIPNSKKHGINDADFENQIFVDLLSSSSNNSGIDDIIHKFDLDCIDSMYYCYQKNAEGEYCLMITKSNDDVVKFGRSVIDGKISYQANFEGAEILRNNIHLNSREYLSYFLDDTDYNLKKEIPKFFEFQTFLI